MSKEIVITPDGNAVITETLDLATTGHLSVNSGKGFVSLGEVRLVSVTFKPRTELLL